jgi:hypothetical protein
MPPADGDGPAIWTGWGALLLLALAGAIPLTYRFRTKRRALPSSRPIRAHVVVGLATTAIAFAHSMTTLPSLSSPGAIEGGSAALAPGALAFFLLFAHVGLGLQLRTTHVRDRSRKRRAHALIALCIVVAAVVHVWVLRGSGAPRLAFALSD